MRRFSFYSRQHLGERSPPCPPVPTPWLGLRRCVRAMARARAAACCCCLLVWKPHPIYLGAFATYNPKQKARNSTIVNSLPDYGVLFHGSPWGQGLSKAPFSCTFFTSLISHRMELQMIAKHSSCDVNQASNLIKSKVRWRFRKILWPSQNIWTLTNYFFQFIIIYKFFYCCW